MSAVKFLAILILALVIFACAPPPTPVIQTVVVPQTVVVTAVPASTATPAATATSAIPTIPAPVAVTLDVKTTVLAVLDLNTSSCTPRPACVASLPAVAALIKKARDAKVPLIFSTTAVANTILPEVAPQGDEPTVVPSSSDKFFNTSFDDLLKARKATTILMVGTRNTGAVLYTAFGANARGYTVMVAVDGISGSVPFENSLTLYQLLNQPGFTNADNKPLAEKLVTLSRSDLITFK